VILVLKDGTRLSRHIEYSRGMPENPMSHAEVERKFMSLASAAVGRESAEAILAQANDVFSAASMVPLNALLTSSAVEGLGPAGN